MKLAGKLSQRERERRILFAKADAQLRTQIAEAFGVVEADIKSGKAAHDAFVGRSWRERLRWLVLGQ